MSTAKEVEDRWIKYAEDYFLGKLITSVRYLSQEEADAMGWYKRPIVIQLSDGTIILPSSDDEGNEGGALFGNTREGKEITCPVLR